MRVIFMGTPDFSVGILEALVTAGLDVVAVFSQPPRKSGRGMKETPGPVHARALELGIPVHTPLRLKPDEAQQAFEDLCAAHDVDVAVVVAYGLILPPRVLAAPRLGCVNVHASLLPRWRGAAPIQRAIEAGDTETGITYMQMDSGLDTGDMLRVVTLPIAAEETGGSLHDRLALAGAEGIAAVLQDLAAGVLTPIPQPEEGVIYAHKLDKAEGHINWSHPATDIDSMLRAFTPWPGAFTHMVLSEGSDVRLKIIEVETLPDQPNDVPPGSSLDDALTIACGTGALRVKRLQRPGKGAMDANAFLRGTAVPKGTRFI